MIRGEQFGHHAGGGFVGTVVLAVAIVALDVAGRGDRNVHPRVMVVRLFGVARVVMHLGADVFRQGGQVVGGDVGCVTKEAKEDEGKCRV